MGYLRRNLICLAFLLLAYQVQGSVVKDNAVGGDFRSRLLRGGGAKLKGKLKGMKRLASRQHLQTGRHFYDDDGYTQRRHAHRDDDDDSPRYTAKQGRKKGKKSKSDYSYGDDYNVNDDGMDLNYGIDFDDDDCEMMSLEESFYVPSATFFLAPDTTDSTQGTPALPGTVFLWDDEQVVGDSAGNSTTVSGTCTRTSSTLGGTCNLVFMDATEELTITVNGFLPNPMGGALAITGGTGEILSNIGEMVFMATYSNTTSTSPDVFLDAMEYRVDMTLGIIICPNQYQ